MCCRFASKRPSDGRVPKSCADTASALSTGNHHFKMNGEERRRFVRLNRAFSLIELMVTLIIAAVLVASLVAVSKSFSSSSTAFSDELAQRQKLTNFASQFVHDVSQSGFVPIDDQIKGPGPGLSVVFDGASPPSGMPQDVRSITIRYNLSGVARKTVTYEVRPLDCPVGVNCIGTNFMKAIFVRRQVERLNLGTVDVHPGVPFQLSLGALQSLRCREIRQAGQVRGLDCEIRRFAEPTPNGRIQVEPLKAVSDQP